MSDKNAKSQKSNVQETGMKTTGQKNVTAKKGATSLRKKKIVYEVLPCESAMADEELMAGIDKVVESNKALKDMTIDRHFVAREQPINIGKFKKQIKEYELLVMRESDVVTGFSLFKKNQDNEWCVSWMVTVGKRRSLKRMIELFRTTLVAGKCFGANDLKFDIYKPEWNSDEDIYEFFSVNSGNKVKMVTDSAIYVRVRDYDNDTKKTIINGMNVKMGGEKDKSEHKKDAKK